MDTIHLLPEAQMVTLTSGTASTRRGSANSTDILPASAHWHSGNILKILKIILLKNKAVPIASRAKS